MRYNTNQFSYDRETKNFIAEASELTGGGAIPLVGQIYQDAADQGIILTSHTSQREATFYLHEPLLEQGEIRAWILRPTPETLHAQPYLKDVEVHILND